MKTYNLILLKLICFVTGLLFLTWLHDGTIGASTVISYSLGFIPLGYFVDRVLTPVETQENGS